MRIEGADLIIDCFLARNEIDLVNFRTSYLAGRVDKFVIGESEFTFGGEPKPMVFSNLKMKGLLPESVEVLEVEIPSEMLLRGDKTELGDFAHIRLLEMALERYPDATFLYQDVDEIPSLQQVDAAAKVTASPVMISVPMQMFYRKANWELLRRKDLWFCPKLIRGVPEHWNIRSFFGADVLPGEPGAHFSFLDSSAGQVGEKLRNYEHEQFNIACLSDPNFLQFCDRFGIDHLARSNERGYGLLRCLTESEFGDVVNKAVSFRPEWKGVQFEGSILWRLIAAQVVLVFRETEGRTNWMRPGKLGIAPLGILHGALLLIRAWGSMQLNKQRQKVKKCRRRVTRVFKHVARVSKLNRLK